MYKLRISILAFLLTILSFGQAQAQVSSASDPAPPDVLKWKVTSYSKISSIVSDKVKYYLGFDITYQNPNDLNEFVRQIRVLLPFSVVKSSKVEDKNFVDMAVAYITDGAEKDLLKVYLDKSDPILNIRWREKPDTVRGANKLEGENEVWLLRPSGGWSYARNINLKIDYLSETFSEFDGELVIVGLKYYLNRQDYHAHEIPHAFIVLAIKDSKGGK